MGVLVCRPSLFNLTTSVEVDNNRPAIRSASGCFVSALDLAACCCKEGGDERRQI